MNLILHVWRQKSAGDAGRMVRYEAKGVNPDMSFLEMLDVMKWDPLESTCRHASLSIL